MTFFAIPEELGDSESAPHPQDNGRMCMLVSTFNGGMHYGGVQ
jgi:hypothetical protein